MKFLAIRLAFRPLSGPVFADNMPGNPNGLDRSEQSKPCQHKVEPRSLSGECGLSFGVLRRSNLGVCTLCTYWPSDWVVLVPDRACFRMFPREPSVCGGVNAVRVPPRARVFPVQGLVGR
jgi:hypothetical protein